MNDIPIGILFGALGVLIILSGFFSGSETGLMTLNRYRLRHLAKSGHKGAIKAEKLLERPDRLIGLILLGNNFVNILASSLATVLALRLIGEAGIAVAAGLLTLVILIFSEVAPKTLAALHPERIAFPAAHIYAPLLKALYPLVMTVNAMANGLLKLFRVSPEEAMEHSLSREELRTVVNEAGSLIPEKHQKMLLSILDLEQITVEDVMTPRNEIQGIDLDADWQEIVQQLAESNYSRMPVYHASIDNMVGYIRLRHIIKPLKEGRLDRQTLQAVIREPHYIPEGTSLNTQLLNFQRGRRRMGFVVDEYGDIQGLVTLEDILEEIVGEFTTDPGASREILPQTDGSYLVDGTASIREINRLLDIEFPTEGPKTLNGLIMEELQSLPSIGTSLKINDIPVEIVQVKQRRVKTARISPHYLQRQMQLNRPGGNDQEA